MVNAKDLTEHFGSSRLLLDLKNRLSQAYSAQKEEAMIYASSERVNEFFQIHEVNWERKICYVSSDHQNTRSVLRNMVKSFLIEQYGQRALHLQIVVVPHQPNFPGKK